MSNDVWRWADPDGQQRRVRLDELRAALAGGHIPPNTPVWRPGWPGWQSAHEVPELTSASLGGAHGVVLNIPPPPLAMLAVQQDYEKKSESMAPASPSVAPIGPEPEPPPPPRYIPVAAKMPSVHPSSAGSMSTVVGLPSSTNFPVVQPPAASGPAPASARGSAALPAGYPSAPASGRASAAAPNPNIPTMLGMPSPAIARPPSNDGIQELSSASLLDAAPSSPDLGAAPPGQLGHPGSFGQPGPYGQPGLYGQPAPPGPVAPTPFGAPPPSHPDLSSPPFAHDELPLRQNPLQQLLADVENLKAGRPLQHKPVVIGSAVLAGVVVLGLFGAIIAIASGGSSSSAKGKTAASASASASSTALTAPVVTSAAPSVTAPPLPPRPAEGVFVSCTVSGDAKVVAPRALGSAAIEAQALKGNLALGFAASGHDAVATMLDPTSFAPTMTVRTRPTGGEVRRVLPLLNGAKLAALPDVDRRGDALSPRRSVATTPLVDVGAADGAVVWAPHGKDSFAKLFALDGDAPVESLRAIPLRDRAGIAVTFRRDNAIRIGLAEGMGALTADGDLAKLEGLGQAAGTLGSPAIASTGDRVVVAWADRASTSDDWQVRWTTLSPHGVAHEASPFALPEGGLGGNAMSPAVASLGGGRFLLAWTEGPVSNHHVRAIAFAADGSTSGEAITISAEGENAGQPAIAVNDDGKGVVAYLSAKGKGLEVHVTPIACTRQP